MIIVFKNLCNLPQNRPMTPAPRKSSFTQKTSALVNEVLEQDSREQEALAVLLDKYLGRDDRILVQKTQMGATEAFLGSVTLEWLEHRVRFASQLPLFRQKYDPGTDNIRRDAETIDEIQQRPLDWSRQMPLALYLATHKTHKFPAVLVVISPPWVDDPRAPQWDHKKRAKESATLFSPLDHQGTLGLLEMGKDVAVFALDGQHRLMGVQGLMSWIKTGQLQRYNKWKTPVGEPITVDDLSENHQVELSQLQQLAYEQIGIEFIPAVVKGETREQARRRVRSVFAHVNLTAIKLSKGQLALLNEDDGFSIIARKIAVAHPLLREQPGRNPRVNWDSATVATKATVLTTLQALQEMSERYLRPRFPHWKPHDKQLIPRRPTDEELAIGLAEFNRLFDYLAQLPSYERLEQGAETPQLRQFSFEKTPGEGHILFRPVGQISLAHALGILVFQKGFDLRDIFDKLNRYDAEGGFANMDDPQSLWYGILYDPNKKRILVSDRDLASQLILYILGGISDKLEKGEIRLGIAESRRVNETQAIGFNGKFVELKKVGVPPLLKANS